MGELEGQATANVVGGAALLDEPYAEQSAGDATAQGDVSLNFVDDDGGEGDASPTELPYWKCEYCNVHTPAAVVKCASTHTAHATHPETHAATRFALRSDRIV